MPGGSNNNTPPENEDGTLDKNGAANDKQTPKGSKGKDSATKTTKEKSPSMKDFASKLDKTNTLLETLISKVGQITDFIEKKTIDDSSTPTESETVVDLTALKEDTVVSLLKEMVEATKKQEPIITEGNEITIEREAINITETISNIWDTNFWLHYKYAKIG